MSLCADIDCERGSAIVGSVCRFAAELVIEREEQVTNREGQVIKREEQAGLHPHLHPQPRLHRPPASLHPSQLQAPSSRRHCTMKIAALFGFAAVASAAALQANPAANPAANLHAALAPFKSMKIDKPINLPNGQKVSPQGFNEFNICLSSCYINPQMFPICFAGCLTRLFI
ncbi:hypothetical protein GQ42DRAFT_159620 [Ramicandelaber brevisporus]|nr:hypothetical protein GQ42DRAFT_159620 [Ramicandelaber brevisporus]